MPEVDPGDDTVMRYVVWHHRFDPDRRERRNVVVSAYDTEAEMLARIDAESGTLAERKAVGSAERREHIGGALKPPGDAAGMKAQRLHPKRRGAGREFGGGGATAEGRGQRSSERTSSTVSASAGVLSSR